MNGTIKRFFSILALTAVATCAMIVYDSALVGRKRLSWASNANHGETLTVVEDGIRDEFFEYVVWFDGEQKLFEQTSFSDATVVTDVRLVKLAREITEDGIIHLHNHPKDYSFSMSDLAAYEAMGCRKAIVVSENYNYILTAENGWPTEAELADFFERRWEFKIAGGNSLSKMYQMWERGLIEVEVENDLSTRWGTTSMMMQELADYFGMEYTEERIDAE